MFRNVLFVALILPFAFTAIHAAPLRAGTAKIDITPAWPVTLAGYASRKDLSKGVHDPLSARALAFEQNGERLVLVSADVLGFYSGSAEPMRKAILEAAHLKSSEMFLCAIHTHSAPSVVLEPAKGHSNNVAYSEVLQGKLIEVVRQAFQKLQPVQVGVGSGSSPVGANRREVVTDPSGKTKIVLGRNPDVMTDRELQVLKVVPAAGKNPAAVLFAYATHSTSLGPRNYLISGDVHGLAEQFLERYLGNDVIAPGFAGASGNIDPWHRVLPEFKTTNGWVPEPVLLGTLLGEEVAHVAQGITNLPVGGIIKSAFKIIELPAKSRAGATNSSPATAPFNVTVARLGRIAFVGLGGEVFNEIGKSIKTASPFQKTFIFTHCNGTAGYVPIQEAYPEGGYEVQSSAFGEGAGEALAKETVELLRSIAD